MTDKQLHQTNQLGHKEDKRENGQTEECMTKNFADYVAVQNSHGENGECNTGPQSGYEQGKR